MKKTILRIGQVTRFIPSLLKTVMVMVWGFTGNYRKAALLERFGDRFYLA